MGLGHTLTTCSACFGCRLSGNEIGPSGASAIAEALKVNRVLINLHTSMNNISGDAAQQLASAVLASASLEVYGAVPLKQLRDNTLTQLNFSNKLLDPTEAIVLAELVKISAVLTSLDLARIDLDNDSAVAIAKALEVNAVLTEVNLSHNKIGASGASAIAKALKVNAVLTSLNLAGNGYSYFSEGGIGPEGATAIAEALKVNRVLTECNMRGNNFDTVSATALAKVASEKRVMLFGIKHDQTEAIFCNEGLGPIDAILIASDIQVSEVLTKLDLRFCLNEESKQLLRNAVRSRANFKLEL